MLRAFAAFLLVFFLVVPTVAGAPQHVVFSGPVSEHKWALKELNPNFPSDWSGYDFLVLEMKASVPQRFELKAYTADGVSRVLVQPFQGVWIRASVPLRYFKASDKEGYDVAAVINKPRNGFMMMVVGPFGPLRSVQALGVTMETPLGRPTLEIRSVSLAKEDPGSEVLDRRPLVDEFGQWIPADWPEKIKSLDQLKKEWSDEEMSLRPGEFGYCSYGGYLASKAKATGFFRVEQIDGKWWFVDPDGHLFLSVGSGGMGSGGGYTRTQGRESYFAALPPSTLAASTLAVSAQPGVAGASFYVWNLFRRYGPDWSAKWADLALRRMEAWGLNTGPGNVTKAFQSKPKPYAFMLRPWQTAKNTYLGMPDVYSDEFSRSVDGATAKECAPRKGDPYLLGYYVGNEPPWPGLESELVDMFLAGPDTATKRELKSFLQAGDTPERRREFVYRAYEKYLTTINAAVKKYDPNHLNMGIRLANGSLLSRADEVIRMGRLFDVDSQNIYLEDPTPVLERAYRLTGRPIIITEFHNGVPGRGLSGGHVQAANQKERGVGYSYYVEHAAACPASVGATFFTWLDQPSTGRSLDGENYNTGIIDITDRPYSGLAEGITATSKRLYAVHSGKVPPTSRRAKSQ